MKESVKEIETKLYHSTNVGVGNTRSDLGSPSANTTNNKSDKDFESDKARLEEENKKLRSENSKFKVENFKLRENLGSSEKKNNNNVDYDWIWIKTLKIMNDTNPDMI